MNTNTSTDEQQIKQALKPFEISISDRLIKLKKDR